MHVIIDTLSFDQMGDPIQLKDEGNKHFQTGDIDKAIECYTSAIKVCKDKKVLAVIHRNRSACYLKKVSCLESSIKTNIIRDYIYNVFGNFGLLFRYPLFFLQENYTNAASDASKGRVMNTDIQNQTKH